jgi:F-type H+-transporting ATPase subunit delta
LDELFFEGLKPVLDDKQKNFLQLLVQNNRLSILPEIETLFNESYASLENISEVKVVTATDVSESFRQKLKLALAKRLSSNVNIQYDINPSILGGAIISIGNQVIDGSVRGKLSRLQEFFLR